MRLLPALLLAFSLGACGSTPEPVSAPAGAPMWYSIVDRVGLLPEESDALAQQLGAALGASGVAPGTPGAQHLRVTVTSWRWTNGAGRASEGLVADADHVASVVQRLDATTSAVIAEERVITPATRAMQGADAMLRAHGNDIVRAARD